MTFDLSALAMAGAGLLLAYTIRGLAGFGSAMVAVPLLSQFWPVAEVVPGIMLLDYLSALWLSRGRQRAAAVTAEVRRLLPAGLAGCLLGALLLERIDNPGLLLLLGTVVLIFGAYYCLQPAQLPVFSPAWAPLAGFVGGTTGALFGVSAPPYVIYLTGRLRGKGPVRATFSYLARFDGAFRLLLLASLGLLWNRTSLSVFALGLPCLWLGLRLGDRLHHRLSESAALRLTGLLLSLLGANLIRQAWPAGGLI